MEATHAYSLRVSGNCSLTSPNPCKMPCKFAPLVSMQSAGTSFVGRYVDIPADRCQFLHGQADTTLICPGPICRISESNSFDSIESLRITQQGAHDIRYIHEMAAPSPDVCAKSWRARKVPSFASIAQFTSGNKHIEDTNSNFAFASVARIRCFADNFSQNLQLVICTLVLPRT